GCGCFRLVARQGRDRSGAGRRFLGGRARAPGLPAPKSWRLHGPFRPPAPEAADSETPACRGILTTATRIPVPPPTQGDPDAHDRCTRTETTMKTQSSQDFTDDVMLLDDELDADLEAWTPQDLGPFGSFGVSRTAELAE